MTVNNEIPSLICCPNCGHAYDITEQVISKIVDSEQKKVIEEQTKVVESLKIKESILDSNIKNQEKLLESRICDSKEKIRESVTKEVTDKLISQNETSLKILKDELEIQNSNVKSLKEKQALAEKEKRIIRDEFDSKISLLKKEHLQDIEDEKEKVKKRAFDEFEMNTREKQKIIDEQKRLIEEQKRKLEQGSVQIQGEVQEEAIEEYLKNQFPLDNIIEIKKGSRGADILQTVNSRENSNCGLIYYESKRTKKFSNDWISKLKRDMQEKNADIGVLITEKLPNNADRMKKINGIWICTFDEFKGISQILRELVLRVNKIKISQENIADKKELLYRFLTSNQFQSIMESFVQTFNDINSDIEREKNQATINFNRRRARIESLKESMFSVFGKISGISGSDIKMLEMESNQKETKSKVEILNKLSSYSDL